MLDRRQKYVGLVAAVTLLLPGISIRAEAAWYARFEKASKISECAFWDESIDISWDKLNKRFGSCELMTKDGSGVVGFLFRCGENNTQFLFRSEEDCLYSKVTMNAGERINKTVFATDGTKNSDLWAAVMDSCFKQMLAQGMVKKAGLQHSDDYCVCASDSLGQYSSDDIASGKTKEAAQVAVKSCMNWLGSDVGDSNKLSDVLNRVLNKPVAAPRIKPHAVQSPRH